MRIKGGVIRTTKRGSKVQRCTFELRTIGKSRGLVIDMIDEKIEFDLDKIEKLMGGKYENKNVKRKADEPVKKGMDK